MFQWLASALGGIIIGFVTGPKVAAVILACTPLLAVSSAYIQRVSKRELERSTPDFIESNCYRLTKNEYRVTSNTSF